MSIHKLLNHLYVCIKTPSKCFIKHIKKHKQHYLLGIFGSYAVVNMILLFIGFFGALYHTQEHASAAGPAYINPTVFCSVVTQIPQQECW